MKHKAKPVFHLIPNAHLDPVWLWDWREGLNEGITTCRTILDLMDRNPKLTFIRGEAAVYEHIEKHDPATFVRIKKMVRAGRWDFVGGTYIQPDTNLPATEVFARHYMRGQRYFAEKFGRPVTVAWAADSFGHSAGIPEIMAAAGIRGFVFTRPYVAQMTLKKPAFWWQSPSGKRVLAYRPYSGWYGCERDEMPRRLDATLKEALQGDFDNVGILFGVGNHGGGPTQRQIDDVEKWAAAHPEVSVVYSGLHRLIDSLYAEVKRKGEKHLPVVTGELGYCLRGCYVSAGRFKRTYRQAESNLARAERTVTAVDLVLKRKPDSDARHGLRQAWDSVLFNSFHDILPGSSIERAMQDQILWTGGVVTQAQELENTALNSLAQAVDTTVQKPPHDHPASVPMVLWNPHPHPFRGLVEMETCLDYRPMFGYRGRTAELPVQVLDDKKKPMAFQKLPCEHNFFLNDVWRVRVAVPVELPPMGWKTLEFGWVEGARSSPAPKHPAAAGADWIANEFFRIQTRVGEGGIQVFRQKDGSSLFNGPGLHLLSYVDVEGSWGDMNENPTGFDLQNILAHWKVVQVQVLEPGPLRSALWVRLKGGLSQVDMTFSVVTGREVVDVQARVQWNDVAARLKLVLPAGERAEFEVPGATVVRGSMGDVPGGRWVRILDERNKPTVGFASDAVYGFDSKNGALQCSVVRSSRYGQADPLAPEDKPWLGVHDLGECRFQFALAPGASDLSQLAAEMELPPVVHQTWPSRGKLARSGSVLSLGPDQVKLVAFKHAEDGKEMIVRVQECGGKKQRPVLVWKGKRIMLPVISANEIRTFRISQKGKTKSCTLTEL
ncbi:MAG: glycoside hydrolase family 38 C-terminal domain-containing protein [Verrucomicrobiae bacterium]|nr:glycoside hydrolase family 38 C-terminal domain-containing protein [Verrucomicrobiae bacterium]